MAILTSKQRMFGTISFLAVSLAVSSISFGQVTISDEQTTALETNGQDLTIANDGDTNNGAVTLTTAGPAVTLNSDNDLINQGTITIADVDDATGVSLEGGTGRNFSNSGNIILSEDFVATNTDDDAFVDGPFAVGTGRTGVLISGASPFAGNVELTSTSVIDVEGNDSFGINLTNTAMAQDGLTGNLSNAGSINVTGTNATGINVASGVTGDVFNTGSIITTGEGAQAINIDADIQGGFSTAGNITNTGFRFPTRTGISNTDLGLSGRDQFGAEDLLQAGSAININGNVTEGILLQDILQDVLDADGNQTFTDAGDVIQTRVNISNITQAGSAPAVLVAGNGQVIDIGLVANITDPAADGFDGDLQYAFINQGTVTANGVFDDFDATAIQVENVNLAGGLSNSGGQLTSTTFVGASTNDPSLSSGTGLARVIVFGDAAIADEINNSGIITASASEAADVVFSDRTNIPAPRAVMATAIEINSGAVVNSIQNSGGISAVLVGRTGEAIALVDRSGTLNRIDNTGIITASATNSDTLGEEETNFSLVAIDVSANSSGFTLNQQQGDVFTSLINGDIRLGTGDDTVNLSTGSINGDIDFNAGNDVFALSGGSTYEGSISNNAGLDINVTEGSTLTLANRDTLTVSSVNFDGTSTFTPVLDGSLQNQDPILVAATANSSVLANGVSSGDINFETGATIAPTLTNVIGLENTTFAVARAENSLTIGDIDTLTAVNTPFLYETGFAIDPNDPNTLLVTLDLRDASAAIADGGLGLDTVQAAAFDSTFTALSSNTDLGDAFANITEGNAFNQAFNQILPEFSAAARQFVLVNVDGATGAVANHLDSARRSPDKTGGAWLQEFAYFADRSLEGNSEQYRGAGFGFTGGLDTALGPFHAVGVNLGFASTEIEDVVGVDEPLDVITFQSGVYAGWQSGKFSVDAYAGGGYNEFEQNRRVRINTFEGASVGEWTGTHINGSLRAGYDLELNDKFWFRPSVSVDYLRLSERAFDEEGDAGIAVSVDRRVSEGAGVTGMFNFGAKFQGKRTWIRPSLRIGARHEFLNDPVLTNFRFIGLTDEQGQSFNSADSLLQAEAFPDNGILLGFSIAAGSAFSSIGFDFDSDIRDGFIRHTGRVVVRLLF